MTRADAKEIECVLSASRSFCCFTTNTGDTEVYEQSIAQLQPCPEGTDRLSWLREHRNQYHVATINHPHGAWVKVGDEWKPASSQAVRRRLYLANAAWPVE